MIPAFFLGYPNWKEGLGAGLFVLAAMIIAAYGYTPYIKIRGKIYALSVIDSQPDTDHPCAQATADPNKDPAPDAYSGILTAKKLWWILVPVLAISSINTYAFMTHEGEGWVAGIGIGLLLVLATGAGFSDGSWGYRIARGQYTQFIIVTVITVGVFTAIYLGAYFAAKHRPLRRRQSMEYRAHPRHQKKYP
ncbi:hypothetical protein [Mycobacterium branderi]|nr:hypothetical protein [Mycobacterium branderi]ORA41762.1 hypothetical protein BST20_04145 [Mycobacterium branderi]